MICDECRNKHCTCGSSLIRDEDLSRVPADVAAKAAKYDKLERRVREGDLGTLGEEIMDFLDKLQDSPNWNADRIRECFIEAVFFPLMWLDDLEKERAEFREKLAKKELLERDMAALRARFDTAVARVFTLETKQDQLVEERAGAIGATVTVSEWRAMWTLLEAHGFKKHDRTLRFSEALREVLEGSSGGSGR